MVRRIALVRRKPELTPEQFWAHYTGPHAAIVQRMPGLRKMVLSRPRGTQALAFDAVGELWFDSVEAVERAFSDPEIMPLLQADRAQFLAGAQVLIVEEEVAWP